MTPEASLEDLLAQFVEERERDPELTAEAFAARHPELRGELLEALGRLAGLEGLLPGGDAGPRRLGRWRVLRELGHGGMGRVLLGEAEDGARAALKVLAPLRDLDPRAAQRFRREAAALERLAHPGVVGVIEARLDEPRPYIAMQYVEGESLEALLEAERADGRCRLPGSGPRAARAARLVAELCTGVEALHAAGLVHRDIKPANVIVTPAGSPVLVDLGLVGGAMGTTLTRSGDLLGTPHFMAPEQALGAEADARSDVWSIGAVLFQALTLEPPHERGDATTVLARTRSRPPRRVRQVRPDVPRAHARVVRRALAVHPRLRTPSAAVLRVELEALAAGRRAPLRASAWFAGAAELWTFRRGSLAAAGLGIAAVVLGWVALESRADERERRREELGREAFVAAIDGRQAEVEALAAELPRARARLLLSLARGRPEPELAGDALGAALERALADDAAGALAALERTPALAADDPLPVWIAARAARRLGDDERAAREAAILVRLLPGARTPRLWLAHALYGVERLEESLAVLLEAEPLWPADPPLLELLARVLLRLQRPLEAFPFAERAFLAAGEDVGARTLNTYSVALSSSARSDEARTILRELVEDQPTRSQAWYNLAFSLDSDHRAREAAEAYARAGEEGDTKALAALAWLHAGAGRGECAECDAVYAAEPELLDPDAAERAALEAIELDAGRQREVVVLAARVALRIERPEGARELLGELKAASDDDQRIANLERALRVLPRR